MKKTSILLITASLSGLSSFGQPRPPRPPAGIDFESSESLPSQTRPPLPNAAEAEIIERIQSGEITPEEGRERLGEILPDPLMTGMVPGMEKKGPKPTPGNFMKDGKPNGFRPPVRPMKPELDESVKASLDQIKGLQDALAEEMKATMKAQLGENASKEERREAIRSFQEQNKERIDAIKEAQREIFSSIRDARPPKPMRPELSAELKAKADALKEKKDELHNARKQLHDNLKDATEEDRELMIAEFKEANKIKHEEVKLQAKELKEEIRAQAMVETEATRTSDR